MVLALNGGHVKTLDERSLVIEVSADGDRRNAQVVWADGKATPIRNVPSINPVDMRFMTPPLPEPSGCSRCDAPALVGGDGEAVPVW